MAKFTVEVEEVTRYAIEVEAKNATAALNKAQEQFHSTDYSDRPYKWQYAVDTNFEVVDELA